MVSELDLKVTTVRTIGYTLRVARSVSVFVEKSVLSGSTAQ